MKKFVLFCFVILIFSFISGLCEEGQININTASAIELNELYGIGVVKADAIISSRPFNSLDDLLNVYGIGEVTLNKILYQGLACVDFEEESQGKSERDVIKEIAGDFIGEHEKETKEEPQTIEVIKLSPKDIKSENDKKVLDKSDYAKYGFVGFCILIGFLLILKNKRRS